MSTNSSRNKLLLMATVGVVKCGRACYPPEGGFPDENPACTAVSAGRARADEAAPKFPVSTHTYQPAGWLATTLVVPGSYPLSLYIVLFFIPDFSNIFNSNPFFKSLLAVAEEMSLKTFI
jgi:hypothetical protein